MQQGIGFEELRESRSKVAAQPTCALNIRHTIIGGAEQCQCFEHKKICSLCAAAAALDLRPHVPQCGTPNRSVDMGIRLRRNVEVLHGFLRDQAARVSVPGIMPPMEGP